MQLTMPLVYEDLARQFKNLPNYSEEWNKSNVHHLNRLEKLMNDYRRCQDTAISKMLNRITALESDVKELIADKKMAEHAEKVERYHELKEELRELEKFLYGNKE